MHRQKTKFSHRVNRVLTHRANRVAKALETRGIRATYELHDRVLSNRASRRRFADDAPQLDEVQQRIVSQVEAEGFSTLPLGELFPDGELWRDIEEQRDRFVETTEAGLATGGESVRVREGKEFVVRLHSYGVTVGLDDPWFRAASSRKILDLANAYLRMWSKLEYLDVWYSVPQPASAERVSSQRWHRDYNDKHLLKAFLYLVDVDAERARDRDLFPPRLARLADGAELQLRRLAGRAGRTDALRNQLSTSKAHRARVIAFYLPQYHPIPENDAWWGEGFTDWRNVVKARPRFRRHYQPHVPSELGLYDLRDPDVRERQAALARDHGISAFCYFHYWFVGRRLLGHPLDQVLARRRPDLPFCLCWANENWTRVWDGRNDQVLIAQDYSEEDDRAHMRWLAEGFRDERDDPRELGFDAAVEFQPDMTRRPRSLRRGRGWDLLRRLGISSQAFASNKVLEYAEFVQTALAKPTPAYVRFPCVTPSWDNSPRRSEGAWIVKGSTPDLYEQWLREAVLRAPEENPLVFVNAWNEWAEGNHLEPCERWGRAYLEATRRALAY